MYFVTGLPILINWKSEIYDFILVIVNQLTKIIYYKPVKVTIDALKLIEVIFKIVVWNHSLFNVIIFNRDLLFILKSWLLLCYFFGIK